MATTTQSRTRSKTKTAKKSAKPVATKDVTPKKVSAAKVSSARRLGGEMTHHTLKQLHLVSGALFIVLAVLAGVLMQSHYYEMTLGFMTSDALLSSDGTVFAPAIRVIYNLDLKWMIAGIMVVSALFSLVRATRRHHLEVKGCNNKSLPSRWLDYGVTFGLLTAASFVLAGMQDVVALRLTAALFGTSAIFSWLAERGVAEKGHYQGAHLAALLAGFLPWLGVIVYTIATPIFGSVRAPWYVYAATAAVFIGVFLFEINKGRQITGQAKNYLNVERNYVVIDFVTKVSWAVVLIAGLQK